MSRVHPVLLVCLFVRHAAAAPVDLTVDLRVVANGTEQRDAQSRVMGLTVRGDFSSELVSTLWLRLQAEANLETGTSRASFVDEFGARQTLQLREASLAWGPTPQMELRAGAIDLGFIDMPLLVSRQTFAGARERGEARAGDWFAELNAAQTVASSPNMAFFSAAPDGGAPLFFFERLTFGWKREEAGKLALRLSHYYFGEPSPEVARRSRFAGSTVMGLGPAQGRFLFGHNGIEAGFVAETSTGGWVEPRAIVSVVHNLAAPQMLNRTIYAGAGATFRISDDVKLTPFGAWYRAESDVVPAYYTAKELGHANREGLTAQVTLEIPRSGITAGGAFTYARSLSLNPYQSDFYFGNLFFGMTYDVL